jgi:N-acyl-L-homoserine lactone synthetase
LLKRTRKTDLADEASLGALTVIVVLEKHNAQKFSYLVEEMFRLRARIFHDHLHWDVRVTDGKERDKYDDEQPVYIIETDDEAREVKGSLRLLPTTGPTLLADVFSDTLPDAVHLSAPTIWECSRLCLDEELLGRGRKDEKFFACASLLNGMADVAIGAGIESIVGNFDASMLRLYRLLGCEVEILGSTHKYGEPVYLGIHHISEPIVRSINRKLEKRGFVRERPHGGFDRQLAVNE